MKFTSCYWFVPCFEVAADEIYSSYVNKEGVK